MTEMREVASGLDFPEGPVVLDDGSVIVVEMLAGRITRVTPDGGKETVAEPGGMPNGLQVGPDGKLYCCNNGGAFAAHDLGGPVKLPVQPPPSHDGGRIERIDVDSGEVEVLYTEAGGRRLIAPNDLIFDDHGGFWFTDHGIRWERNADRTFVMYAKADGSEIREVMGAVDSPNGIGLSPGGDRLYVAESYTAGVWWWEVTGPGEVKMAEGLFPHGGQILCKLEGFKGLDSLAVDGEGNVCLATLIAGGITSVSPAGEIVDFIETGDIYTTNLAFGGDDMKTAYLTASLTGRLLEADWPRPGLKLAYSR